MCVPQLKAEKVKREMGFNNKADKINEIKISRRDEFFILSSFRSKEFSFLEEGFLFLKYKLMSSPTLRKLL